MNSLGEHSKFQFHPSNADVTLTSHSAHQNWYESVKLNGRYCHEQSPTKANVKVCIEAENA